MGYNSAGLWSLKEGKEKRCAEWWPYFFLRGNFQIMAKGAGTQESPSHWVEETEIGVWGSQSDWNLYTERSVQESPWNVWQNTNLLVYRMKLKSVRLGKEWLWEAHKLNNAQGSHGARSQSRSYQPVWRDLTEHLSFSLKAAGAEIAVD